MERSWHFLLGVMEGWWGERYDLSIFYKLPLAAVLKIDGSMCGQSSSRQVCEEAASDASARAVGARSTVVTMAIDVSGCQECMGGIIHRLAAVGFYRQGWSDTPEGLGMSPLRESQGAYIWM